MKHSTKVTALGASLATTLAVVAGATFFHGDSPGTTALAERSAAVATTTTSLLEAAPAVSTTTAPTIDEPEPDVAAPTRVLATSPAAAVAPTVNTTTPPVNDTTPPAPTTTVVAPTWVVTYQSTDGHVEILTSAPPAGRFDETYVYDDKGVEREHWWTETFCAKPRDGVTACTVEHKGIVTPAP
jgi:hypothetical protein